MRNDSGWIIVLGARLGNATQKQRGGQMQSGVCEEDVCQSSGGYISVAFLFEL